MYLLDPMGILRLRLRKTAGVSWLPYPHTSVPPTPCEVHNDVYGN
jgi:hypothetical protein